MDITIDALYNILKQNQGDVNDALGYKKKAVVITSDPLALVAENMNVSKRKKKVVVSSDSEGSEFVKLDDKKEDKKADEKKRDMSKVKCYKCKKDGHFAKDCKKAKVKDYNYYKTKMLLAKKHSDEQVLLAEDQAWMESSSDSDQEINVNMVFMAQIKKVLSDLEASSAFVDEKISECKRNQAGTFKRVVFRDFMVEKSWCSSLRFASMSNSWLRFAPAFWSDEVHCVLVLRFGAAFWLCVLLIEDSVVFCLDTRPPMLDRTDFASWQQRIRLYCHGKENGVNILRSIDEGPYRMGTVKENLAESTEGAPQFGPERPRIYSDLTSEEKDRYNADIRAINILLQGLPKDIYTLINHYIDAKDI
nr:integrase, catalytic region, zinc finger, CCHC-type, peptidase aspartic, catalytic [Tanacetum cinerariifolium]